MHLARFPRARFAHLPTPLEPLPRLGAELGIDLWVKRDDCTGLAGGGKPYVIPGGGSNTVGALGYVDCARELVVQADALDLKIDRLVTATGSAGTHAGLVAGFAALSVGIPILGFGVRAPKPKQEDNV